MNFRLVLSVIIMCGLDWCTTTTQVRDITNIPNSLRITGGTAATANQFPFMVYVRTDINGIPVYCGGSLISQNFVLTAASCVEDHTTFIIGIGSITLNSPNLQTSTVFTIHPGYNAANRVNNIALIQLPANAPAAATPILLLGYSDLNTDFTGLETTVMGWGQNVNNGPILSTLQWTLKTPITNAACSNIYGPTLVSDGIICAQGPPTNVLANACDGDYGGPMIWRQNNVYIQIGVVNFLSGRGCTSGDPAGYTRISAHLSWISATAGIPVRP